MSAIVVENLGKTYRGSDAPAVDGLDLCVGPGEIFGLLGPNGAGKTTTISILCGLLRADRGRVVIGGVDVTHHPARVRPLIGLVPQDIALYATLTGRENLAYFGRMHGLSGRTLGARVDECLSLVGLEPSADRAVATYSGGMKRRANLVAGLIHRPPILILDEPTVGIDVQSRSVIFDNLRALNRAGTTMVYATHDLEGARALCSRVAVMDRGRALRTGPPEELVAALPGCRSLEDLFLELTGRQVRD
jgi:ABC-2 type transport system ATP-binding protein